MSQASISLSLSIYIYMYICTYIYIYIYIYIYKGLDSALEEAHLRAEERRARRALANVLAAEVHGADPDDGAVALARLLVGVVARHLPEGRRLRREVLVDEVAHTGAEGQPEEAGAVDAEAAAAVDPAGVHQEQRGREEQVVAPARPAGVEAGPAAQEAVRLTHLGRAIGELSAHKGVDRGVRREDRRERPEPRDAARQEPERRRSVWPHRCRAGGGGKGDLLARNGTERARFLRRSSVSVLELLTSWVPVV